MELMKFNHGGETQLLPVAGKDYLTGIVGAKTGAGFS
jgi:hypothetical protein